MRNSCLYIILFLFSSCAQIVAPTGGDKDVTPPALVAHKTFPANESVNFKGNEIILQFDEFIRLNNPVQNIIITPVPPGTPRYILKGKTLRILFEESLKDNTTYTIQLGKAVVDYTEGNAAQDLNYVFSTGTYLDSVRIQGNVKNVLTGADESGVVVLLYSDLSDSAVFLHKPEYMAITGQTGFYKIKNIRKKDYRIYAVRDLNGDLKYTPGEEIAFHEEIIKTDTADNFTVDLVLFKENKEKLFVKKIIPDAVGKVTVITNTEVNDPVVSGLDGFDEFSNGEKYFLLEKNEDTLNIFVKYKSDDPEFSFILSDSTQLVDTIRFRNPSIRNRKVPKLNFTVNVAEKFNRFDSIRFSFNSPVVNIDPSKINFMRDSVSVNIPPSDILYPADSYTIPKSFVTEKGEHFSLVILPGAFTDIYNTMNDSASYNFSLQKPSYYGNLFLEVIPSDTVAVVVQLLTDRGGLVKETTVIEPVVVQYNNLLPGSYKIRLIHDKNRNGKWDTGDVLKNIQPEKITWFKDPVTIRSNWDLQVGIEL